MNTLLILAVGALLLWLAMALVWLALPADPRCPLCGAETLTLRTTASRLLRRWLVLRWCVHCGWESFARTNRPRPTWSKLETVADDSAERQSGTKRGN